MGAGKSSVGRALGARLGWRFVDLDEVIVARAGRSIAAIFERAGEAAFRAAEAEALSAALAEPHDGLVLALGGGAWIEPGNAAALRRAGTTTIFLDAPVEQLAERCLATAAERPLARDLNQFRQLHQQRRPRYLEADVHLDTSCRSVDEVVAEIVRALRLEPHVTSTPPEVPR